MNAIVVDGDTVYVGGDFTEITTTGGQVPRSRLAAVSASSGELLPWAPSANAVVHALFETGDTVYIGGDFTTVSGEARQRLAAVTAAGALQPFNPGADGSVLTLTGASTRLYAGGNFRNIGTVARTRLAAFSIPGGTLDTRWKPKASGVVETLKLHGGRVYAGGNFSKINGAANTRFLAAVNPTSGALDTTWPARAGYKIYDIAVDASGVYAGGGGAGGHVIAWDLDGSPKWEVQTDGGVQAVTLLDGEVYTGGHYQNHCTGFGTNGCVGPTSRRKFLSVLPATGELTPWAPAGNSPLGVWALASSPGAVHAGGDFTTINGARQARFASFR